MSLLRSQLFQVSRKAAGLTEMLQAFSIPFGIGGSCITRYSRGIQSALKAKEQNEN
jgi:hypothetical protein